MVSRCCLYVTELERRIYQNRAQQAERFRKLTELKE